MIELLLNNTFFYDLAITLLHFMWQGALIAVFLKVALKVTPTRNSQVRYLLSSVAMTACLLFPLITFQVVQHVDIATLKHAIFQAPTLHNSNISTAPNAESWHNISFNSHLLPLISVLWLVVVSVLTFRLITNLLGVSQLRNNNVTQPAHALNERFIALSQQVVLSRVPKLLISYTTSVPMAIGWLKPVVLLPCSMVTGLTPAQLDMLILHELAHIKRHDYAINLLQTVVETFLFFHPAVHWISKQMRNEREYCSDDIAVHHCGNPIAYAHTLTDTANHCLHHKQTIPSMAIAASGGDLKLRVLRVIDQQHCTMQTSSVKWFSVLLVLSTLALATTKAILSPPVSGNHSAINTLPTSAGVNNNVGFSRESAVTTTSPLEEDNTSSLSQLSSYTTRLLFPLYNNAESLLFPKEEPYAKETSSSVVSKNSNVLTKQDEVELSKVNQQGTSDNNLVDGFNNENRIIIYASKHNIPAANNESLLTANRVKLGLMSQKASLADLKTATESQDIFETFNLYQKKSQPSESTYAAADNGKETPLIQAELVSSTEPKYPLPAQRNGIEGDIEIEFNVDTNGFVKNIRFVDDYKAQNFKNSIRESMRQWRFKPATLNGQPVESTLYKLFSFNLAI